MPQLQKANKFRIHRFKPIHRGSFQRFGVAPYQTVSALHRQSHPYMSTDKYLRDILTSRSATTWVINYGASTGQINKNTM